MTGSMYVLAAASLELTWPPLYALFVCAGAAVWWGGDSAHRARRTRLVLSRGSTQEIRGWRLRSFLARLPRGCAWIGGLAVWLHDTGRRPGWVSRSLWRLCPWACVVVGALVAGGLRTPVPLLLALGGAPLLRRWLRREAGRRAAAAREAAVLELCTSVAAELRAGQQPQAALLSVGVHGLGSHGAAVLAAARFGGDLPRVLRRAAQLEGAHGLGGVAACWQVAAEGGAGLAEGLERVAGALRMERDQHEDVRAQLAGPRATASILALLPLLGLLLGTAMGAEPLEVLLHSSVGWGLLGAAVALECVGLAWVSWIVRRAEGVGAERSVS